VIYLLHGFDGTNATWFGSAYMYFSIKPMLDELIAEGTKAPVIAVSPNSDNKYGGSWYTNSTVSGNWEDFIVLDVVDYTDANYRTLAKATGRALVGHSMEGYGAVKLAMR
jgi:S-formylglutathione hydrolase FrmB